MGLRKLSFLPYVKVKHIIAKLAFSLAFLIFLEQVPAAALGRQVLVHEQFHLAVFPTPLGSALFVFWEFLTPLHSTEYLKARLCTGVQGILISLISFVREHVQYMGSGNYFIKIGNG